MAALLALHGISTPGVLFPSSQYGAVMLTGGATLPVGAAILAFSVLELPRFLRGVKPLLILQAVLLTLVISVGALGLFCPEHPAGGAEGEQPACACLLVGAGLVHVRRARAACSAHLPAHAPRRRPARHDRPHLARHRARGVPDPRLLGPRLVARPHVRARRDPDRRHPGRARPRAHGVSRGRSPATSTPPISSHPRRSSSARTSARSRSGSPRRTSTPSSTRAASRCALSRSASSSASRRAGSERSRRARSSTTSASSRFPTRS